MRHIQKSESLTTWICACGGRWMNDRLKGKTDWDLAIERDLAFEAHVNQEGLR